MNIKIVRNFSMLALMLGAMFVLSSRKAQAQNFCGECSSQLNFCMYEACYPNGCGSGLTEQQQMCMDQYNQCMSNCD